jgi:molybdopterin synthase sulfur carrier subunit
MISLLYFAELRERLQLGQEQLVLPDRVCDVTKLMETLRARGGIWNALFGGAIEVRAAVNCVMADGATLVRDGDEVALFPPVTGG